MLLGGTAAGVPKPMSNTWRIAAGIAILVILAATAVLLAPFYVRNMQLQQFLEESRQQQGVENKSAEMLQVAVADKAAQLGIPLRPEQVRVDRTGGSLRIEARYIVRIDLPVYTVDLHFHAGSGAR